MYCKMGDLFRWFLLGLRFSAINSGIKQNLMMSTGTCGIKLYARCNIFKKKITNMTFGIIYILVQVSFLWDCFRVFFFYFSSSVKHGSRHFFSVPPPPYQKKASYGPDSRMFHSSTFYTFDRKYKYMKNT